MKSLIDETSLRFRLFVVGHGATQVGLLGTDPVKLRKNSRSIAPPQTQALPFGAYSAIPHESLVYAIIHPPEMHRLVDAAAYDQHHIAAVAAGGLENLEISALAPHGLMGESECSVTFTANPK